MAINFPATGGQPTDGSYTYTVAGITYAWNGESWTAAGAGASATDRTLFSVTTASAGSAALTYDQNTGVFDYTPPNLSGYLTAEADTLATVTGRGNSTTQTIETDGGSFKCQIGSLNQGFYLYNTNTLHASFHWSSSASGNYFTGDAAGSHPLIFQDFSSILISPKTGSVRLQYAENTKLETSNTGVTITGALTAGGLTYPNTNGTANDVLTSDGSGGVTWSTPAGLQIRQTQPVSATITSGAASNLSLNLAKTFALLSIASNSAAWVVLYTDTASRTADASRNRNTSPAPGSGVLAEVIFTASGTQLLTPGVIGFTPSGTTCYAKVVNDGSTGNVQIDFTYVQLEA